MDQSTEHWPEEGGGITPIRTGPPDGRQPSRRREELLTLAYDHVLVHGLTDLSLRPLAKAIGSSPRVLLFLFGSKENLVRALLDRSRADELTAIANLRRAEGSVDLVTTAQGVWDWLAHPLRRPILNLWVEAYARSLIDPAGPWGNFAAQTVQDWLDLLASVQPAGQRQEPEAVAERTAALALLRGALLDLLATGDRDRIGLAVASRLGAWIPPHP